MIKLLKFEMNAHRKTLLVWGLSLAALMVVIMLVYSTMEDEMAKFSEMFESFGAFGEAFGVSRLNMGTPLGFYGIEMGAMFSLGGSMFAAILGVSILSKEEANHTSEFLFSHPLRRTHIITAKLLSVIFTILILHIFMYIVAIGSFALIGAKIPWLELLSYHFMQLVMNLEIAAFSFCLSAFLRRQNFGLGLGLALIMYFLNIIYNVTDDARFLQYVTPFVYADSALILGDKIMKWDLLAIGLLISIITVGLGYWHYSRKDLA